MYLINVWHEASAETGPSPGPQPSWTSACWTPQTQRDAPWRPDRQDTPGFRGRLNTNLTSGKAAGRGGTELLTLIMLNTLSPASHQLNVSSSSSACNRSLCPPLCMKNSDRSTVNPSTTTSFEISVFFSRKKMTPKTIHFDTWYFSWKACSETPLPSIFYLCYAESWGVAGAWIPATTEQSRDSLWRTCQVIPGLCTTLKNPDYIWARPFSLWSYINTAQWGRTGWRRWRLNIISQKEDQN